MGHREADCWSKHGKPDNRVNIANEPEEEDNTKEVLISMEDVIDFAGITFTNPTQESVSKKSEIRKTSENITDSKTKKKKTQNPKQRRIKKLSQVLRQI